MLIRWEQRNANTHFIDSSNVYGSTETEAEDVRDKRDRALLAVTSGSQEGRNLLPTCRMAVANNREPESCDLNNCGTGCTFVGGDFRVNEMPALTVQHTVWMREHNRIATQLKRINPTWRGERIFQETRRIVNAEWQNIIFSEWLPILLGPSYVQEFGLTPGKSGYSSDYNPKTDPIKLQTGKKVAFIVFFRNQLHIGDLHCQMDPQSARDVDFWSKNSLQRWSGFERKVNAKRNLI